MGDDFAKYTYNFLDFFLCYPDIKGTVLQRLQQLLGLKFLQHKKHFPSISGSEIIESKRIMKSDEIYSTW